MSLDIIRNATTEELRDREWLEDAVYRLGIYPAQEIPASLWGNGLGICQYPNQVAPYLIELSKLKIKSYAEIGVWVGGNFALTIAYLRRFGLKKALALDIDLKPEVLDKATDAGGDEVAVSAVEAPSTSPEAKKALKAAKPDLILVDGDHTEKGARADCKLAMGIAKWVAVHDIVGEGFPGVIKVWSELEGEKKEWTDQHPDQPLMQNGMGLVAVA